MATAQLTVGEPGTVDLAALVEYDVSSAAPIPDGMTFADGTLTGTPTTVGTTEVVCMFSDPFGNDTEVGRVTVNVVAAGADPEDPDPEDPEPGDPDPEDPDELDPWDVHEALARALGARVAAFVGQPGNADVVATAEAQVPIVAEYVRGFTRGRGFRGESPAGPLRAVIVSGVARLATNPEQVAHFQTGDYSERPAQLAGWTLAELGVLHRYRRTTA